MRRTLLAVLLGGAALSCAVPGSAAQPTGAAKQADKHAAAEALAAAQRDFTQFAAFQLNQKGGLPDGFPLQVKDVQELKQAKVSYGFAVHTVDPADLLAGRGTMRAMAKPVNQFRFVITVRDRAVGLATVEKIKGRYETVAYGAAVLAKDLDLASRQHGNADKSNLRLLRIYQARSDFLEVDSEDGRGRFAPLHSARASLPLPAAMLGQPSSRLLDETELMQPLRAVVKQTMAAPL
ncbi:hypothetical protein KY495_05145 [Massilia sp. PAMC28688]|nr:hypothetical protein KY495_05145 [Massilia sp. PAMC28688]